MKRDLLDFHRIQPGHIAIHALLCNWAAVVRVHATSDKPAPMFRSYRSTEVWQAPEAREPLDMLLGWKMEKAVSQLPPKHREAVRWVYVWPWKAPGMIARRIAVHQSTLHDLVHEARSMLKNRSN